MEKIMQALYDKLALKQALLQQMKEKIDEMNAARAKLEAEIEKLIMQIQGC